MGAVLGVEQYILLGTAYCHGIMDGEIIKCQEDTGRYPFEPLTIV